MKSLFSLFVCFVTSAIGVFAQSLEIHHISVGAGDASLIVQRNVDSLRRRVDAKAGVGVIVDMDLLRYALDSCINLGGTISKVIMVDMGTANARTSIPTYIKEVGVTKLDYITVSHYHEDHIGCAANIIKPGTTIYDRGTAYHPTGAIYNTYHKKAPNSTTATIGTAITLTPVSTGITENIVMTCVAANKNVQGLAKAITEGTSENDYGLAWLLTYGKFRYFTGGDMGGVDHAPYVDVESSVAKAVGHVCAMKINHHGSQHSSNPAFLDSLRPKSCVISCGTRYSHPTMQALANIMRVNSVINKTHPGYDYIYVIRDTNVATQSAFVTLKHTNHIMMGGTKQPITIIPTTICH
ncbi:MAG: MBL fold metallo-hydrolase [Mucinivorans sp.]